MKKVHAQKKIFYIKRDISTQKGFPMLLSTHTKGHSIVGTNITRERKTSQLWALFCKRFKPRRIFLHKKRFFCIKAQPNVTFYACKRSFNCRYQYHIRRENWSTASIVLKKVHAQKKIFCIKRDFSA